MFCRSLNIFGKSEIGIFLFGRFWRDELMIVDAGRHWQPRAVARRGRCSGNFNGAQPSLKSIQTKPIVQSSQNDIEGMHMKSLARFKSLPSILAAGAAIAVFSVVSPRLVNGQSVTIDFRFDNNAGVNPTTAGATTVTLTAGSAGQTYLVDIFATVSGGSTPTMNGLKDVSLRGISDITTAASAFATGTGIGALAGSTNFQYLPPFNAGGADANTAANPNVKVSDLGSTNAATAGNTTNSAVSATADGILDFGGTVASQVFAPLSFTNAAVFGAFNGNGTASGANGFSWEIGTFKFTTGTASSTAGSTTLFFPAAAKGSGGGDISTNGSATTTNVPITIGSALTFVVGGGGGGGNDSVLNMTPATVSINSLAGGTNTTNLSVANTAADAATATGAFTGAFSGTSAGASQVITGSPVGTTPGQAAISYLAGGTPTATPVGFSYTITNTSNASDAQGAGANKVTAFTVNVGSAKADNTGVATVFGPALTGTVAHGGSYLGLSSAILTPPVAGAGSPAFPSASYTAGTADVATILAGSNATANGGGSATVSMAWRTRTAAEAIGGPAVYSPSLLKPTTGLVSDVLSLTGITAGAEAAGGITDPFVLELAFNPALTPKGGAKLAGLIANKLIYMISLNSTTGLWDRATIDENFNNKVGMLDPSYGVNESFSAYLLANPTLFPTGTNTPATVTAAELNNVMGAWGVDTTTTPGVDMVWSVLNHNSQFAVVPEPSTLVLAAFGLMGLIGLRRRMKKSV
jgi:hypothetical protein